MPARRIYSTLSLLLGIALVLAACGPDSNETMPTAAPAATAPAAPAATAAPTSAPMATDSAANRAGGPQRYDRGPGHDGPTCDRTESDGADGVSGPRGSTGATLAPAATMAPTPRPMMEATAQAMMP